MIKSTILGSSAATIMCRPVKAAGFHALIVGLEGRETSGSDRQRRGLNYLKISLFVDNRCAFDPRDIQERQSGGRSGVRRRAGEDCVGATPSPQ
jgi:hypothetical protein